MAEYSCVEQDCGTFDSVNGLIHHVVHEKHCTFCGRRGTFQTWNSLDNFGYNDNIVGDIKDKIANRNSEYDLGDFSGGVQHPVLLKISENKEEYVDYDMGINPLEMKGNHQKLTLQRHVGCVCPDCEKEVERILEGANETNLNDLRE